MASSGRSLDPLTPSSIRRGDMLWGAILAGGGGWASSPTDGGGYCTACAERLIDSTSSGSIPVTSAISSAVGSRPSSVTSLRSARPILLSFSTTWTGILIVRALSASARAIAWRIHQVA